MDITKQLDGILYSSEINYSALPEIIIEKTDALLLAFPKHEVLAGLIRLKPLYDEKVNNLRKTAGGSGHAGQELMIEEMKQFYLPRLITYVKNK